MTDMPNTDPAHVAQLEAELATLRAQVGAAAPAAGAAVPQTAEPNKLAIGNLVRHEYRDHYPPQGPATEDTTATRYGVVVAVVPAAEVKDPGTGVVQGYTAPAVEVAWLAEASPIDEASLTVV